MRGDGCVGRFVLALFAPLFYLILCALLAALLAYPVFVLMHSDSISFFRSLVSRGGQALLVLGLFPLFRWLGLSRSLLGFDRKFASQLLVAFLAGTVMLALHVLVLVALDVRAPFLAKLAGEPIYPIFGKALVIGIAVALLEETIFRGALLGIIDHAFGSLLAVAISAFYYASLHFIGTYWTTDLTAVGWDTGFRIAMDGFAHLGTLPLDSWLGLFMAGLLLGTIRVLLPRGLGYCVGLHAGWVFVIKTAKPLTYFIPQSPYAFMVGRYDYFVGYFSAAWLFLLLMSLIGLPFWRKRLQGGCCS